STETERSGTTYETGACWSTYSTSR
ncbi:MAG: hypothetical protein K0Q72_4885, partial [Armatimonadetes bacterium]|nr:hypothetical protein [Armatimonadota bacterium]